MSLFVEGLAETWSKCIVYKHFWKFIFYIVFKEHGDEEKMDYIWFIRVNGMHHTIFQLRNNDSIPVQSSAIHPEEDRIFLFTPILS